MYNQYLPDSPQSAQADALSRLPDGLDELLTLALAWFLLEDDSELLPLVALLLFAGR